MNIYLSIKDKEKSDFKADFISEVAVPTPEVYLLTYNLNRYHYIIKDGIEPDVRTDNYSELHLTRLQHIVYGHFFHNNKKINAQVGFFIRRVGYSEFVPVLLSHDFGELVFENAMSSFYPDKADYLIIDLDDFNKTRKLLGQSQYSFQEFVAKKLSKTFSDENGLTLDQETSLFSHIVDEFDAENLMTTKGMTVFLEEQSKKSK